MKYSEEELEEVFKEAQRRYPVGTEFQVVHMPDVINKVTSVNKYKDTFVFPSAGDTHVNLITNGSKIGSSVWVNGQWARIVKYPKTNNYEIY